MGENLHKGHRKRVKDRYLREGLDSFEDHQLLEIMLFYCYPMKDTNEIAHKMIKEFGTLTHLFEADALEIMNRCNVTENVGVFVSMIPSIARKYHMDKWKYRPQINSSKNAGKLAISMFTGRIIECFSLICLDAQNRLIFADILTEGTVNESAAYPREVVKSALKFQSVRVILTHNHPSGSLEPSNEDIAITIKIIKALDSVDIDVIDHIIVGGTQYYSFREKKTIAFDNYKNKNYYGD